MWFNNLIAYKVMHDSPELPAFTDALDANEAKPLNSADARRMGWIAPAGLHGSGQKAHRFHNHTLLSALRQERLLPSSVVHDELTRQVNELQHEQNRMMTRKEKTALKEQIVEAMLPQAFVRKQRIDVWWDDALRVIGINTSSRARAEEVLDLLRETLGSLKVVPLSTQTLPLRAMTQWLDDPSQRPADMVLGDSVMLKAKGDDGVLRGRRVDLDSDEVQQLLQSGKQAAELALTMESWFSFVLNDDLKIKRLRFDDRLIEEADHADDGDDALARMETDFIIMAGALHNGLKRLTEWLGGETTPATGEDHGNAR